MHSGNFFDRIKVPQQPKKEGYFCVNFFDRIKFYRIHFFDRIKCSHIDFFDRIKFIMHSLGWNDHGRREYFFKRIKFLGFKANGALIHGHVLKIR